MVLETHMKLCVTEPDFLEKIFWPQNWENGPKMGQKMGFLNILKNFVITFCWICSIMKIYIIYYLPEQIPYLGKLWFPRYGPKCSQPIRLQDVLIEHIFRTNQWNSLIFFIVIKIHINQSWSKKFWMGMARNGCDQSDHETLKLVVSQEWIDGMN